jgi:hypothetical protein
VVTFAAALALAPLMGRAGLSRDFSVTVAFALVLTPIELGPLLGAAHRATDGRDSDHQAARRAFISDLPHRSV